MKLNRNTIPITDYLDLQPERRLALAVLQQGIKDAIKGCGRAREWVESPSFAFWCDLVGLNADYLQLKLRAAWA